MKKLATEKNTASKKELSPLAERYIRAEEAYNFWIEILEEE